jgi:GH25 family lysozyme M1 (1,4-beta-N-acetylmuramidase)
VARYQHPRGQAIDWVAAKRSGIGYAFIKATEGTTVVNPWFRSDWSGARRAGLPRGAYHFARPARPLSTATAQARAFLKVSGRLNRPGDMPAVLDLENNGGLPPGELIAWAQEWVRTVQNATGRAPLLYTYRSFWRRAAANSTALNHLPLWLADYSDGHGGAGRPAGPTRPLVGGWPDWAIWQWTDNGRVSGVAAPVDVNVFNGGAARMRALADGTKRASFAPVRPGPPSRVAAEGGNHSADVSWLPGYDGNSRPRQWRVTAEGTGRSVVVSGRALSARLRGLRNGRAYRIVVEQRNAAGWSRASAPVVVGTDPAASVTGLRLAARSVVAGESVRAVAQVRADGVPLPRARVEFWAERAGREVRVATALTGPDGKARVDLPVPASSRVQARFAGLPRPKRSSSGQAGVVLVPRLSVTVPVSARNGRAMGVSGTALGAPLGSDVVLQQHTRRGWVEVGTVHVRRGGRFQFVLRAAAGVRQFRVVVPATRVTARTQSAPGRTGIR